MYIYVRMYARMSGCTETEFKNKFLEKYQANIFLKLQEI